MLQQLKDQNN